MEAVAITRRVKPGMEAEFEARITAFFRDALQEEGSLGASLIRPVEGSGSNEYGILRVFTDAAAKERFYGSELFARWSESVRPFVEGEPERAPLHGLEAFFRRRDVGAEPPAWKMALLTWIAVNPAVYVSAALVGAALPGLPPLVELLAVNVLVVASLTWLLMPLMTRLAGRWLR